MSDKLLTSINSSDLRLLDEAQLPQLAQDYAILSSTLFL
jgi:hypothetical protein